MTSAHRTCIDPVVATVTVAVPPARAWDTFTTHAAESRAGYVDGWPPVLDRFVEATVT